MRPQMHTVPNERPLRDLGQRSPLLFSSTEWQKDAACADAPERDKAEFTASIANRPQAQELATRYCHHCPVVTDCFNWAYDETHFTGVAGGAMFAGTKERSNRTVQRVPRKGEAN